MQRGRKSGGEAPSRERGAEAQVRGPARRARLPARARPFGSVLSGSWRPGCACLQPPSGRGQSPWFGGQVWLPSLNCRADARVARVTASQLPVPSQSSQSGQCPPRSLSSGHEAGAPPPAVCGPSPAFPAPGSASRALSSSTSLVPTPSRLRPASAPSVCPPHSGHSPGSARPGESGGRGRGRRVHAAPSPRCLQPPCSPLPLRPKNKPCAPTQWP